MFLRVHLERMVTLVLQDQEMMRCGKIFCLLHSLSLTHSHTHTHTHTHTHRVSKDVLGLEDLKEKMVHRYPDMKYIL